MLRAGVANFDPDCDRFTIGRPAIGRLVPRSISWLLAAAGMFVAIHSATAQTVSAKTPIEFDIPSQSLNSALERYSEVTGRNALYDTSLAAGRLSSEVRGALAPDEALKALLSGTGLKPEFVAETTFVLLPAPADQQAAQPRSSEHQRYYGLIQARITDALCRSHGARPGRYRFTAVLWIAADGAVSRSFRVGSAGTLDADQRIDATLRSVRFSTPPPKGFQQPVLILIVPQGPGVTRGCETQ